MSDKTSLGDRMKNFYESRYKISLTRRTPVILRIDGKAFHTYTRKFDKPFDFNLMELMAQTTLRLCEEIQGSFFAYQQSDEISIFLKDYNKLTSEAWFDFELCKMCSVGASLATALFNEERSKMARSKIINLNDKEYTDFVKKYVEPLVCFDCRAFNLPVQEVNNYFTWRQQDASRNSVQMAGQANFSHKSLQGKSCSEIQEKLFTEKGINWNDYPTSAKRGIAVYRTPEGVLNVDDNIPIFSQQRDFIDQWLNSEE